MNIIAIACYFEDLSTCCLRTLSGLSKQGNRITLLIVPPKPIPSSDLMQKDLASLSKAGLGQIHLEQDFDYSSVTQRNAEIIRNYINSVKPKVAFIPFWKARDHYRCTLSNTSLISCRGIGTILMYEPEANHLFNPTVVFSLSLDNISPSHSYISPSQTSGWNREAQATTLEAMSAQVGSAEEILTVIKPFRSSKNTRKGLAKKAEVFESHRMLLVEEGLNDVV